jgi:hypothetical protein
LVSRCSYIGHDNDDRNKMIRFFSFDGSLVNLKGNVVEVNLPSSPPSFSSQPPTFFQNALIKVFFSFVKQLVYYPAQVQTAQLLNTDEKKRLPPYCFYADTDDDALEWCALFSVSRHFVHLPPPSRPAAIPLFCALCYYVTRLQV